MEIGIHANMCDENTCHVSRVLDQPFKELGGRLNGEYGGVMEHLWIDFELIQSFARADGRVRWPFRFQKRVSDRSRFGLPPSLVKFNVGHYSVRPDFKLVTSLPTEQVIPYALSLIYDSTTILIEKQKRLGGFDAVLFRSKFLDGCRSIGYEISSTPL